MPKSGAYGLWLLVILNSAIVIIFAFSFWHSHTTTEWRSFGAFSAFLVALFTEIRLAADHLPALRLAESPPGGEVYTHNVGHLWKTLPVGKGMRTSVHPTS